MSGDGGTLVVSAAATPVALPAQELMMYAAPHAFSSPPSPALSHIAAGLTQRLGFQFAPQPEFASLASAFGHVLWRMHPAPSQVALEVIVLCDRGRAPQAYAWQREHFLQLGAQCNRLAPDGTIGLVDRYRRFTIVEIGAGPQSAEEEARLLSLRSDVNGVTIVESVYVDSVAGTLWSAASRAGFGANLASTVMLQVESPADWIRAMLATPQAPASGFVPPLYASLPPSGPALFTSRAIALSSFLASPFAGGLLVAWNLHRTKRAGAASLAVVASLLFALIFLLLAMYTNMPGGVYTGISIGGTVGLSALAAKLFPDTRNAASPWLAVLVSVCSLVGIFGFAIGIALVVPEPKVDLGNEMSAVYEDGATKEDAKRIGTYLSEHDYLAKGAQIRVGKQDGAIKISITVEEGSWDKAETVAAFQELASSVVRDLYPGKTVKVVLTNAFGLDKKTLTAR